ncbi:MAG TPA: ATP-binding protein [Candidatus Udaeobacter sp.]|nr:ATP-binding protein [Candidatus Udaeobacter sp.]
MKDLEDRYRRALERYMLDGSETALSDAYLLAREAVRQGVGLLELVQAHRDSLRSIHPRFTEDQRRAASGRGGAFFAECLAPYEMSMGGLREFGAREHSKAEIAVHERSRAVAALEASERKYRLLFEANPIPMMFSDLETDHFVEVNQAAVAAYGWTRAEFVMLRPVDIATTGPDSEFERLKEARDEGRDVVRFGPVVHRKKDGTQMRVLVTTFHAAYDDRPARFAMVEDVTEKEELEARYHQAERLESLGQLAGGVAHDFNNLLGVILNFAGFVKQRVNAAAHEAGGERWAPVAQDLERVERAATSAAQLTHQLLSFARREIARPEALGINSVLTEIEPLLRRTLGEHIVVVIAPGADLWRAWIDPGQLEQVIMNLAVNARDAMKSGGTLTIDTSNVDVDATYATTRPGLMPGRYVRLRVSDTGTGMDPETLHRAFEPFFTTKPKGEGTGLGLASVYGIVKQAGGHVAIYSEPGIGTRVTVLLPATNAPFAAEPPPADQHAERVSGTVLVVEDDEDMREVVARILGQQGYSVIVMPNGREALRAIESHSGTIDLLVTDVVMPHMQGTELAAHVTARWPGVRVLFMSGYAQPMVPPGVLSADVELLEKPFSEAALLAKVRQVMEAVR